MHPGAKLGHEVQREKPAADAPRPEDLLSVLATEAAEEEGE
jgi:hypothetical protein